MNWYPHHLGDFAQATAHLSMLEDAAYSRLLRWYYAEEQPIPADLRAACRIARATSNDEREAVRVVLEEFFELTADGYRQARADREIEAYRDKSAKAARSAEARWSNKRTQCGRNANASGIDANASKGDADAMLANSQQPTYSVPIGTGAAPPMLPPAAAPAGDLLPLPADPVKVLFDAGVSLLTAAGVSDRQARADREIEAYRDKSAKAARSAEARWSNKRTQCGRNANASGIDANASKGDADAMLANSQQPTYSVPIGTGAAPPMLPPAAAPAGDLLPLPADPVKVLFDAGVSLLTAAGVSDRQARSLIGQWRRTAGDADVLAAIVRCRDQRITAPVPWLSAALRPRAQRKPSALHLPANLNYETSL